jgi:DNA repair photolyase
LSARQWYGSPRVCRELRQAEKEIVSKTAFTKSKLPAADYVVNAYTSILISSVTESYNHFETKYKKTRKVLEELKNINCNME